jgi:hypothetical protein
MQDASISLSQLVSAPGVDAALAKRIAAADADGSGYVSLGEMVAVFKSEQDAAKERRLLRRCGRVLKST